MRIIPQLVQPRSTTADPDRPPTRARTLLFEWMEPYVLDPVDMASAVKAGLLTPPPAGKGRRSECPDDHWMHVARQHNLRLKSNPSRRWIDHVMVNFRSSGRVCGDCGRPSEVTRMGTPTILRRHELTQQHLCKACHACHAPICKTRAMSEYLLTANDLDLVPCVVRRHPIQPGGRATIYIRSDCAAVAHAKHGGVEGFLAEKRRRGVRVSGCV